MRSRKNVRTPFAFTMKELQKTCTSETIAKAVNTMRSAKGQFKLIQSTAKFRALKNLASKGCWCYWANKSPKGLLVRGKWRMFSNADQIKIEAQVNRLLSRTCHSFVLTLGPRRYVDFTAMTYVEKFTRFPILWKNSAATVEEFLTANVSLRPDVKMTLLRNSSLQSAFSLEKSQKTQNSKKSTKTCKDEYAFHGTSSANAWKIAQVGFDASCRRRCVLGQGDYHADLFHKSLHFGKTLVLSKLHCPNVHVDRYSDCRVLTTQDSTSALPVAIVTVSQVS
jgi:hypothetical protein